MKKKFFLLIFLCTYLYSQEVPQMEFQNQKITDILVVLADLGKCSIIPDETVKGTATYYFQKAHFAQALENFLRTYNLSFYKENDVYYVSRININILDTGMIDIDAEDVDLTYLVNFISKKINKTIIYDPLPKGSVTIHSKNTSISKILEILIKKNWNYELIEDDDYFYIQKINQSDSKNTRFNKVIVKEQNNLYSVEASRATFSDIIEKLFSVGNKEYTLLLKTNAALENINFKDKEFDQILRLILDYVNGDFVIKENVYYIFETQKNGVIKKLKNTVALKLNNISVQNAVSLFPTSLDASSLIKIDKNTNTIYINGSDEEIKPLVEFIKLIDRPITNKEYERFDINYASVSDVISLLPTEYLKEPAVIIPGTNSFIAMVTPDSSKNIKKHLEILDKKNSGSPIRLKYIKSEELLKYLPPTINKDDIVLSSDDTLVFFVGSEKKRIQFIKNLDLIDVPKPQIRYELLIIQHQKGDSTNWKKSLNINPVESESTEDSFAFSGMISNLLNINFDVVSQFGYQFAVDLSHEIGENKTKVLADTTLHGISGTDVKFQNTNTFRYNEGIMDSDSSNIVVKTATKEITSGLQLTINGWVSGDGMITMKVNAEVSKQGTVSDSSGVLPPTSEKVVTSEVRTKSGTPIIIGGLLQTEISENVKKTPLLGYIPLIGKLFQNITKSEEITEMTIYIVPHVYIEEAEPVKISRNIERYYCNFILEN